MTPTIQPHVGPHRTLEAPVTPDAPRSRMLQHPVPPGQGEYEWIYLWQLPLRMMHWAAAISIVALVITGFWIGRPYFMGSAQSTSSFGTQYMRLGHFLAGMLLTVTGIVRIYWLVAGNRFERFPALFPVRPRDLKNLVKQARFYMFMPPKNMPEYIGHNPMAQVPTLEIVEDDGPERYLVQSVPILEYLDERWPSPPLLPAGLEARQQARALAEIINAGIQPLQNLTTMRKVKAFGGDEQVWTADFIRAGMAAFDAQVAATAGRFCVGDAPTIADCCLVPQLYAARRFGVDPTPWPRLAAIEAACAALPAFAAAHPDRQPDAVRP